MNIEDPVSEFYFTAAVQACLRFGVVALIEGEPRRLWVNSEKQQQALFDKLLAQAMECKGNTLFEIQKILARSTGEIYASLGEEPTRVQWRETVLRTMAPEDCIFREQRVLVELYSGRIVVIDRKRPFSPSQYEKWPRENCLTEIRMSGAEKGRGFQPKVIPGTGDSIHYQVERAEDLTILRTECQVSGDLLQSL